MTRCTWLKQHLAQAPATYGIKTAFCSVLSTQVKESPNKFQTMIRAVPANINQFGSLYAWRCRNFGCWNPGFIVGHRGVLRHTCRLPLRLTRLVLIILHYANEIFPMKRSLVTTLRNFSQVLKQAMSEFHKLKMQEINKIVKELWRTTYQVSRLPISFQTWLSSDCTTSNF